MKILVAKDAGYCFGVRDAVNLAKKSGQDYEAVYMLGDIVHNERVVSDFGQIRIFVCPSDFNPRLRSSMK